MPGLVLADMLDRVCEITNEQECRSLVFANGDFSALGFTLRPIDVLPREATDGTPRRYLTGQRAGAEASPGLRDRTVCRVPDRAISWLVVEPEDAGSNIPTWRRLRKSQRWDSSGGRSEGP
jgi:hypothetical protein